MNIKEKFITAIEKTGDPTAPIKLQDAYCAVNTVGQMFASNEADKNKTAEFSTLLLTNFPDDMDYIAKDPSFICALCSMLSNALVAYSRELNK